MSRLHLAAIATCSLALGCSVGVSEPNFGTPNGADSAGDPGDDGGSSTGDPAPDPDDDGGSSGGGTGDDPPGGDTGGEKPGVCGDGLTEGVEDCDDAGESATCNEDCTAAVCGDGKLNTAAGEICDGETVDNGSCSASCVYECDLHFGDCNDDLATDGCETALLSQDDCGGCGEVCAEGLSCVEGSCATTSTHGNDQEFPEGNLGLAHYLLGGKVSVPADATLTHLSLIAKEAGPNVMMGLYADEGGNPGALVASTLPAALKVGPMELAISPTVELPAGEYWLMAIFDDNASVGLSTSDPSAVVKYVPYSFGLDLPDPFGPVKTYEGQVLNYYVNVLP